MISPALVLGAVLLVAGSVLSWNWLRYRLPEDLVELRQPGLRDEDRWAIWCSWALNGFLVFATLMCLVLVGTALFAYLRSVFA